MIAVEEKVRIMMESGRRTYPCRSNRASEIGHPCLRYLVYSRTRWEEKKLPEMTLLYIFEMGRVIEDMAVARLKKSGLSVDNQQRDFEDKETGITGHIDGLIDNRYPLEIKSMSGHIWPKINNIEDMIGSAHPWVRKYPAQLQLYLYLAAKDEEGCFYLVNKQTGEGKDIWTKIDYTFVAGLLEKAKLVNNHIHFGTLPDRHPYDPDLCDGCDFAHICLPAVENRGQLAIEQSPMMIDLIKTWFETDQAADIHQEADDRIRKWAKLHPSLNIAIGDYMISKRISKAGAVTVKISKIT